ncbi:uncharacterized protein LOC128213801 [Mya arenaria]|uniref:uncharacterized protein LOC128213801 n=1 Tax=Mya arenaria TaxID=6604 RepID=UPI0022E31A07|nr:uncharacterized protein LOC128213801 [Mya arenaria]
MSCSRNDVSWLRLTGPLDAVKDGHTAADTTEVTETSEDALGESAEVVEHAYHDAVGNSGTVAPSTVVSEHAEGPPQDAVKDDHAAAYTTEVTEPSKDVLSASAEVLKHAYHDAVEIRGIVYHPQLSLNMLKGRLEQCSRFDPGTATVYG